MRDRGAVGFVLALCIGALAAGCATPVSVHEVPRQTAHRVLTANAISRGEASLASRTVLLRLGLLEQFEGDPAAGLEALHEALWSVPDQTAAASYDALKLDHLFALAEISFLYAQERERRCELGFVARRDPRFPMRRQARLGCPPYAPYYLAAAVYAYAFLFPDTPLSGRSLLDPRNRVAADLYNLALISLLDTSGGSLVVPSELAAFHLGSLEVEVDEGGFLWADRRLSDFVPANTLDVRGLRNRYRTPGIGAAYVAGAQRLDGVYLRPDSARISDGVQLPVTAFLRFESPIEGLRRGALSARLEVIPTSGEALVDIGEMSLRLEADPTAALAAGLHSSRIWDYELTGFRRGALPTEPGLHLMSPYRKGRIPVVLIHGTASSPARWAEMLNELAADPAIRDAYQAWFFFYGTGNPVLYSADVLRRSLRDTIADLDPEGRDPALRRLVLLGHSQGGLLARLQISESGDRFWSGLSDRPIDELDLGPESRDLLEGALFFEPAPYVERAIFIATPHRGSFLARGRLGRLAARLFRAPENLLGAGLDLARSSVDRVGDAVEHGILGHERSDFEKIARGLRRIPSSVENMRPNSRFTRTLQTVPLAEDVRFHSIIPVRGPPPAQGQDDGVVAYESAHLEGAESELVVFEAGHSVQSDPEAILEVRRILHEHLRAVEAATSDAGTESRATGAGLSSP